MHAYQKISCTRKRKREADDVTETESEDASVDPTLKVSKNWKEITGENLHLSYLSDFLIRSDSRSCFEGLEREIEYFTGDLARVRVFGKWHDVPRQQVIFILRSYISLTRFDSSTFLFRLLMEITV